MTHIGVEDAFAKGRIYIPVHMPIGTASPLSAWLLNRHLKVETAGHVERRLVTNPCRARLSIRINIDTCVSSRKIRTTSRICLTNRT